jgi:uncharacterized protein (DUF433 family)
MTLQELETQIQTLTPIEKAQVIQHLLQTNGTASRSITKTPGVMGGDACLANTRLPIWLFIDLRHQGASDAAILKMYPHLTAADLVNVWVYAHANREEIEQALSEQDATLQEPA